MKKLIISLIVLMFLFMACGDNNSEKDVGPPDASVVDMIEDKNIDVEEVLDAESDAVEKDLEDKD